ncbi:MAG: glycerol-3-phosphate 1-O-acyltransferase PlsY [Roseomonas sp.]|jgi:glycerol-3-phosphate acyltransferase PlsY|nr:glycerol-3-phosphate 1-O-acyltransferase PlsY [Roseomonas sp.]MCA3284682.1 glycerol-3-phosphate 1-O-acyltransferase PlsY [Roseomonas sp.]MCA3299875.1 glycerol-3-phosphate 1-O-acyltransferase PlsY [Roseomonas sp.]
MAEHADSIAFLIALVGGYLIGSVPFGLLLTKAAGLGDIRQVGSGNIGATNVLRTGRKGLAAATLILDGLKGAVAMLLARQFLGDQDVVVGTAAVLGHLFPVWLGFRGGKGVATGLGVLLAAAWPVGLACCALWLVAAKLLKMSSAAALTAFAAAPLFALVLSSADHALMALLIAVLVFWRHEANIRRLLAGTEPRIGKTTK